MREINRHEHLFWQLFERINIAVRRKGGGELVTADSLFTILLSRARKSLQAAVEEQQHDDHLLREELFSHKERSSSPTRRAVAPPQGEDQLLLHKERSNEQSAAYLGPASSRRCSTGVPLDH